MSINPELLTKAAKVYDCSEPVEGMKPKMQYEEHKDLTPDEFSREHTNNAEKSAAGSFNDFMNNLVGTPKDVPIRFDRLGLTGAGIGGVYGALTAPKGKMLRRALVGAGLGGLTGLGAGAGASLGMNLAQSPDDRRWLESPSAAAERSARIDAGGVVGLLGGGLLANRLGQKAVNEFAPEDKEEDAKKTAALRYGSRAAHAILPTMEHAFRANSRR